ncbi:MAG: hypothetical protein J4O01_10190 [Chloroflexi bacterium]|nr:hypothetical protein [Chloroflexota bacterium]MCH8115675.1 hypothetical protein [Chloroflexota bacterium]MCI0809286.1 hypothetical protein [Chloroflexota bacterium]MCI0834964.1 hypothetical protein [Chloroflexota bacterium]MCI0852410.1 hypothetical protein [Chloroflexota bacterium]
MASPFGTPFGTPLGPLLHHSEPIDPTLWEWLSAKIDHVLGLSPGVMVLILGTLIVLFPIVVMVVALRRRRGLR